MSGSSYELNISLYRDSLSTPWGFRLEGGRDFHFPLTIQRVFAGSPACSDLQRGDIITRINNRDATNLLHNEANELIRSSGGSISLGIKRGLNFTSSASIAHPTNTPVAQPHFSSASSVSSFKLNPYLYPSPTPSFLLKQQTNKPDVFMSAVTNGPVWHQPSLEDPNEMYVRSQSVHKVRDPKPVLSQTGSSCVPLGLTQVGNRSSVKRYRPASTMPILQRVTYSEPGVFTKDFKQNTPLPFYDKKMVGQIQQSLSKAVNHPVGYPIVAPVHYPLSELQQQAYVPHYQNMSNSTSPAPGAAFRAGSSLGTPTVPPLPTSRVYSHHEVSQTPAPVTPAPVTPTPRKPDGPKVVMQQYNSPVGLYSRETFQEEYYKQVGNNKNNIEPAETSI